MVTWNIDRFLRSGPMCAIATLLIPMLLAVLVNAASDVEKVLGVLLLASGIIFIGSATGSMVASGMGSLLFGTGTVLAEVAPPVLLGVGIGLFATLMIHDLAGAFRRAPSINKTVWRTTAVVTLAVSSAATIAFTVSYFVGALATWQSIVVPFGIAAIGFAVKLAADSHVKAAHQLTARRRKDSSN